MKIIPRRSDVAGLAVCTLAGAIASWLHSPLPWMIGPLFAMAAFRFFDVGVTAPWSGRFLGQLAIGTALGLYFTPSVAREMVAYWGVFVAAAIFAMLLAYLGAYGISKFTDTDRTTAFFASVPGGSQEMVNLALRYGGKVDRIVIAQSLRIILVVVIVPFTLTFAGVHGADVYASVKAPVDAIRLLQLFACCAIGGVILQLAQTPNAWMLGPLFVSIALTANGVEWSAMPNFVTNAAQVLIGCNLGQRFERESMRGAPRFVAVVSISVLVALAVSALFGVGLAYAAALPGTTMILATAPGGIAEMCLTAKVLQLGVPVVTAAHVARVALLLGLTAPMFRLTRWMRNRYATGGRR